MFYPDSAADCTIMGQHKLRELGVHTQDLEPPDGEGVDAANKSPFKMVGRLKVTLEYFGKQVKDVIHVTEDETDLLVSWDSCIALGILHAGYPRPIFKEPPGARAVSSIKESRTGANRDDKVAVRLLAMISNRENPSESDREKLREGLIKEFEDVFSVDT